MLRRVAFAAALTAAAAAVAHAADAPNRPQIPKPPFPYTVEEVTYTSAPGVTLSATLTLPEGKGPVPAVLLIAGSGPVDRDETYLGHKPFAVLSDYLTRHGIATLRADKRGRGKSGGDYHASTTLDFATDAAAGVDYLRHRAEVDVKHIGLIGHSEGGIISPLLASRDKKIAFVVTIGGPSLRGDVILPLQKRLDMLGSGAPADVIAKSLDTDRKMFALSEGPGTEEAVREKIKALLIADDPTMPAPAVDGISKAFASPWMRYFLQYDPATALKKVRCPILMVFGGKDTQVPPDENQPVAKAALARNPAAGVVVMPGLNHLLQRADTGLENEYGRIEETMAPDAMAAITAWVKLQTAR